MILTTYEPDMLDDVAAARAEVDPQAAQRWAAIKLVSDLRILRTAKGMTQDEVAGRMGVAATLVARIERRPWDTGFARILAYAQAIGAEFAVRDSAEAPMAAA